MTQRIDRRSRIADAVIAVLAERGSRGLTHRSVDEVAGLPVGSTSYYLRSRVDLLTAAVSRLAELDAEELDHTASDSEPDLWEDLAQIVSRSLQGVGAQRTRARYELVLEAARRPEIHRTLAAGTAQLLERLIRLFPSMPQQEARLRASDLMTFLDGLLLANVTTPQQERQGTTEIADALMRFRAMVFSSTSPSDGRPVSRSVQRR